jgi:Kef-type K+ transport system membrane component KefB/nucleotide-binding universal stress UspA family protein
LVFALICFPLSAAAWRAVEYCDVYLGSEKVFTVTNTPVMSAVDRAQSISAHLQTLVGTADFDPTHLSVRKALDGVPVIMLDNVPICGVTTEDSAVFGKSADALAIDWAKALERRLAEAKQKISPASTPKAHESKTLNEHAVLLLFLEIGVLLLASLIFGELMVRLGQPAIIGQILAGLVLGQTFFGNFFPDLSVQLFPQDSSQSKLIEAVSWIGVSFLLMLTGMETDTSMLKRLGKPLLYIALLGLFVPLLAGAGISVMLPAVLRGDPNGGVAFAVFLGTVFAVSSVPVVAKILMDMKLLKRDVGQLVLSASLSHDLLCCLLLAVIAVLSDSKGSSGGGNPLLTAIVGTIGFVCVVYFGRFLFFRLLRWVNDKVSTSDGLITAMIVMLLLGAATTQALGIHIVLGAFAVGVILSQAPVINHKVVRPLEIVTMGFFAPIFFAASGLNVNLGSLLQPKLAAITLFLCAASMASKLIGCYAAGKIAKLGAWESLAIGIGANAKGSMGLILAMLGYSLHIITLDMLAIVIFVSLFSTAVAPPLMKWSLSKVKVTEEEQVRLAKEERRARTVLSNIRRVLWPTSGKARNRFIGKLLDSIGKRQVIETVVLWVKTSDSSEDVDKPFHTIAKSIDTKLVGLEKRTVKSDKPIDVIVDEANLGYDLLVMATDKPTADADHVFGTLVDEVILNTSTRVLVIYDPEQTGDREIKKVVVPVSGSELSVSAGEFGISLASSLGAKVTVLSIAESELEDLYSEETKSGEKIQRNITEDIEGSLKELANALNVDFTAILVQSASHAAQAIIMSAQQQDADLIVLGAEPKMGKGLFLGHTINFVLRNAPCAVAILKLQA